MYNKSLILYQVQHGESLKTRLILYHFVSVTTAQECGSENRGPSFLRLEIPSNFKKNYFSNWGARWRSG
jgi:hypothetical protein